MALELMIRPAEVTIPQAIDNFEQLKAELEPKMKTYESLVVSESGIAAAKKDKADLNKLKAAVDDQRKAVKRQCLELQNTFESQCKELTAMIDKPISAIDKQIKAFDEQRKQDKYNELEAYFKSVNSLAFLNLEDILDPKWANTTMKLEKLKTDIAAKVLNLTEDLSEIVSLYDGSPMLTAIIGRFEETKDKSSALAYAAILEKREQQRREQEQIAAQKEAARQQGTLVEKTCQDTEGPEGTKEDIRADEPEPAKEPLLSGAFRVTCTRDQLLRLRQYMIDNGIKFEIVKGGN